MKHMRWWFAALAVAPAFLLADQRTACPLGPFDLRPQREQQQSLDHRLSVTTEVVGSARRRSVGHPASSDGFPPEVNFIDRDVFARMRRDGIVPTVLSDDAEFLRRVTLDLTGQIPDTPTLQSFLADSPPAKRAQAVDRLLASDAFVDRWTMWLGDLVQNVQISANAREFPQGRNAYYHSLHDSIAASKPYDQIVRELISGTGDSFTSGPANYSVRQLQPNGPIQDTWDNLAAQSADKFLGMPFLCLSCHNGLGHLELVNTYLKSKMRYDFWGEAAFFARTRAQRIAQNGNTPPHTDIEDTPNGQYLLNTTSGNKTPRQPINGQTFVPPAFLLTGETPRPGEPYRDALGRMLTSNPQFARATVNYVWQEMFGLGIVEPADNFDLNRLDPDHLAAGQTLQPTDPVLLNDLTNAFIAGGDDLRGILRTMAVSSAYQLATDYAPGGWNEAWTPYFARHIAHRLTAEALLDAIARSTNVPVTFNVNGIGAVNAAMKLPDTLEAARNPYGRFLDEFGRGNRDDAPRSNDSSIAQALSLMNDGTVVVSRVRRTAPNSTVAKLLASTSDPATIADALYLTTLSRHPTAAEQQQAVAYLRGGNLGQRTEDLQWVLINALEFLFD